MYRLNRVYSKVFTQLSSYTPGIKISKSSYASEQIAEPQKCSLFFLSTFNKSPHLLIVASAFHLTSFTESNNSFHTYKSENKEINPGSTQRQPPVTNAPKNKYNC